LNVDQPKQRQSSRYLSDSLIRGPQDGLIRLVTGLEADGITKVTIDYLKGELR
jgi:hypothetical protein